MPNNKTTNTKKGRSPELDAYEPSQIAERVMEIGVKKTNYPSYKTFVLGLMGGAFISFGALYELYLLAHPDIDSGIATIIAPFLYSVGYIMAFISGAEIFTTNNLSAMGWASGHLNLLQISKNWGLVLISNIIGALLIVTLFISQGLSKCLIVPS